MPLARVDRLPKPDQPSIADRLELNGYDAIRMNTDLAIIDSVILRCVLLSLTIISQSCYPARGYVWVAR
jgi:hypothetical protein